MRSMIKLAMVGAVLVATSAQADVILPSTGNGELVLFVRNNTTGTVYARGLDLTVDNILTQAAIQGGSYTGPVQSLTYSLPSPIAADSTLQSFLGSGTDFSWTVMGGDNTSPTPNLAGSLGGRRYVATTQVDLALSDQGPTNANLQSLYGNLQGMLTDLNANLPDTAGSSSTSGLWGTPGTSYDADLDWFGAGLSDANALGSAAHMYLFSSVQGTNASDARVYEALNLRLTANGTLESVGSVAPVPLPPALWLLGSALVGFAGVARRRAPEGTPIPA